MEENTKSTSASNEREIYEVENKEILELIKSNEFNGFCGCGHSHDEGINTFWNDSGHRTQIEMGIRILATLEPSSEFLSLWTMDLFRSGFYHGIWQADYERPYNNIIKLGPFEKALFVSHFYDPTNGHNLTKAHPFLGIWNIENKRQSAWDMCNSEHHLSIASLDLWRLTGDTSDLHRAGIELGRAAHYFTDLTQPMHAANFANVVGAPGNKYDLYDYRHSHFENLADRILNNPKDPNRASLLTDLGTAQVSFESDLKKVLLETAKNSKGIYDDHLNRHLNVGKIDRSKPLTLAQSLPAYKRAFPEGQLAFARFIQSWVSKSHNPQPSKRLRSDWVAVTERKPVGDTTQPAMFYRRDGDLQLIFRYFNGTTYVDDTHTFHEYGGHVNSNTAFASCYDHDTAHAVLFISDHEGKLFYWEVDKTSGKWKKVEIEVPNEGKVSGGICSTYDHRYKKPCAFYRGENGMLHYVFYSNGAFRVNALSQAQKIGGSIATTWDPRPAMNDNIGHVTASYIDGHGYVHHLNVRDGVWKDTQIEMPQSENGHHADSQMIASIYSSSDSEVLIFWGHIRYELKKVPGEGDYYYREQKQADLKGTKMGERPETIPLYEEVSSGKIAATSTGSVAVYFNHRADQITLKRSSPDWSKKAFVAHINNDVSITMIDAYDSVTGKKAIVGYKSGDRQIHIK